MTRANAHRFESWCFSIAGLAGLVWLGIAFAEALAR